jgi:hypothetical protein
VSRRSAPWLVVALIAIGYPVAVLAGGGASFPSRAECVHPATADGNLEVVFGRFDSWAGASDLLQRVLGAGFKGTQVEPDGCGLLKVAVHGIPTLHVGGQVIAEARSVGLQPQLEVVPP